MFKKAACIETEISYLLSLKTPFSVTSLLGKTILSVPVDIPIVEEDLVRVNSPFKKLCLGRAFTGIEIIIKKYSDQTPLTLIRDKNIFKHYNATDFFHLEIINEKDTLYFIEGGA